jgi:hypothetical protein
MKAIHLTAIALLIGATSCTNTYRSAKLSESEVTLDIAPVQVDIEVDTTQTLSGVTKSTVILGFIRIGENKYALYPHMQFERGPGRTEKQIAVSKALEGTDFDVLLNPKFIIQQRRAPFVVRTTCQVVGFGGTFIFE